MNKVVFLISAVLLLANCTHPVPTATASYSVEHDQIVVPDSSPFRKHLEIVHAKAPEHGEVAFNTVGQIIALGNSSGVLSSATLSWAELDPALTLAAGLHLSSFANSSLGTAFGLTTIPAEYTEQIHLGQSLEIARYGLKKSDVHGVIVRIQPRPNDKNSSYVTFEIPKGQDWYPGTNCEVRFPLLHVQTSIVPTTSILHEGFREFVLKEVSSGHFQVVPVFIVDETPSSAQIIGITKDDSLIGSGAILLKPELHNFIHPQGDSTHGTE